MGVTHTFNSNTGGESQRQVNNLHVANFIENSVEESGGGMDEGSCKEIDVIDEVASTHNLPTSNNMIDSEQQQSYFTMNFKPGDNSKVQSTKTHYQISIKDCLKEAKGAGAKGKLVNNNFYN